VNDVARSPLNEAFVGPPKIGGPRLQPCQPNGKSGPELITQIMETCSCAADIKRYMSRPISTC